MPQVRATQPYSRVVSGSQVLEFRKGVTHYFTPTEWEALAPNFKAVLEITDDSDLQTIAKMQDVNTTGATAGAPLEFNPATGDWEPGVDEGARVNVANTWTAAQRFSEAPDSTTPGQGFIHTHTDGTRWRLARDPVSGAPVFVAVV